MHIKLQSEHSKTSKANLSACNDVTIYTITFINTSVQLLGDEIKL